MRFRTKTMIEEIGDKAPEVEGKVKCSHYWVIESPNGAHSKGVCRFCNEEREFVNSFLL